MNLRNSEVWTTVHGPLSLEIGAWGRCSISVTDVVFRQACDRLRHRVNITDLTFHNLRHEAISRMSDNGMKIREVMAVSGHRTASQLFRYVQV
mgnify:FL=1